MEDDDDDEADDYVRFVAVSTTPKAMSTREVEEAAEKDQSATGTTISDDAIV